MKKEIVDLLENYVIRLNAFLGSDMECVFNTLVIALGEYYDNAREDCSLDRIDFINNILTDYTNFMIKDFLDYLEESEGAEYGEE